MSELDPRLRALVDLGRELLARGYEFTTPTPETHRRVIERDPEGLATDLRGAFGWNRRFHADLLDPRLDALVRAAQCVSQDGEDLRSRVRFSSLGGGLYAHSSYPTLSEGAVFFGPDTYRFARFVRAQGPRGGRLIDIGAGSGAGGLSLAAHASFAEVVLTDINPVALRFCQVNAELAGLTARVRLAQGSGLEPVEGPADCIIANPPYLLDTRGRAYRDGGGTAGEALSVAWATEAVERLAPGGRFLLYTGSAIEAGCDRLKDALAKLAESRGLRLEYGELDPDVFGEELENPAYAAFDRIAAIGATLSRA
jgi:methylase of polypeptide subunit release factors